MQLQNSDGSLEITAETIHLTLHSHSHTPYIFAVKASWEHQDMIVMIYPFVASVILLLVTRRRGSIDLLHHYPL
jgi:hypothetical protein